MCSCFIVAREFLDTLPFDSQCSDTEEQESLRFLYYSQLDVKVEEQTRDKQTRQEDACIDRPTRHE